MSNHATSIEAEQAFYAAIEQADLTQMMQLWANTDLVVCIHPMGVCLRGVTAIAQSWREIFSKGPRMGITLSDLNWQRTGDLAVHTLCEHVTIAGRHQPATPVLVTNIYQFLDDRWQIILHHASLTPDMMRKTRPSELASPPVLH